MYKVLFFRSGGDLAHPKFSPQELASQGTVQGPGRKPSFTGLPITITITISR